VHASIALNDLGQCLIFSLGKPMGLVQNSYAFLASPMRASSTPVIRSYSGVTEATAFGGSVAIGPGSWIEIYGEGFTDHARSWKSSDFVGSVAPTSLDGVTVQVGGQSAFVSYISPEQVNAFVPFSIPPGEARVTIKNGANTSPTQSVDVNGLQPGLLVGPTLDDPFVIAIYPDFATYALPPGTIAGVPARLPVPGDTIILFGTGFGPVNPSVPDGQITTMGNALQAALQVSFASVTQTPVPATVTYAGLAPGYLGLYQFNIVVPTIKPSPDMFLVVTVNGTPMTQVLQTAVGQ